MSLLANCHCGKVSIVLSRRPRQLTECNCSICRRYGALWAYGTPKTMTVQADESALACYMWGDRCIEFYHCSNCGCLTHYESIDKGADSRIAVNARMLPVDELEGIRIRHFDGANSWQFLD